MDDATARATPQPPDPGGGPDAATATYSRSLEAIRELASDATAVVFDLDGVVREFEPSSSAAIARDIGLTGPQFLTAAFGGSYLGRVVTGHTTFAEWVENIHDGLVSLGVEPAAARDALERWVAYRGTPIQPTLDLMAELEASGRHVFVFTNGTDNIPHELRQIGLDHLIDVVLNTSVFGVAKPEPGAYAAAHAAVEARLGRTVARADVVFTDDRADNVAGAQEFGWRAVVFGEHGGRFG